jgi:hypothetical protein
MTLSASSQARLDATLAINAKRTIRIERYEEDGYFDRFGYLKGLADEHGVSLRTVIEMSELLGPEEDFDGLVTSLEDGLGAGL